MPTLFSHLHNLLLNSAFALPFLFFLAPCSYKISLYLLLFLMCPQEELFIATLQCHQLQADEGGRDLQRPFCPTPLLKEGHLEQGAHGQMAFEYLQRWRLHNLLGQPVPALGHFHSEKSFMILRTEPVFLSVPIASSIPLFTSFSLLSSLIFQCTAVTAVKVLVHGHPLLGIQLVSFLTAFIYCPLCYNILINSQKKVLSLFFLCLCST